MNTITATEIQRGDVLVNRAGEPVWLATGNVLNWSFLPTVELRAVDAEGNTFTSSLPDDTTYTVTEGVEWSNMLIWDGPAGRTLRLA